MSKLKMNTRKLRKNKLRDGFKPLQMLTCYDFQTAQLFNQTELDLILVGDSLGNVILGYDTTVEVTIEEMRIFSSAVRRGAPDKFIVTDMPFGTYAIYEEGMKAALELFQKSKTDSLKLEGASQVVLKIIKSLTETGVPVMGHIGLTPQSVHELGGYYTHGKTEDSKKQILEQARELENAGCFAIVLECVEKDLAKEITDSLSIPTIGIGAGLAVDGQVLVINDLLKTGELSPPKFCKPISDLYSLKKDLITKYLSNKNQEILNDLEKNSLHH